jgi:AraC-like DNA-binding protein
MHGDAVTKPVILSTDDLPKELDSRARFARWHEIYTSSLVGPADITPTPDKPFFAQVKLARTGAIGIAQIDNEIVATSKSTRHIAAAPMDTFGIAYSRGPGPMLYRQRGRELPLDVNEAAFFNFGEPLARQAHGRNGQLGITVPRKALLERVSGAFDLAAQPLDQSSHPLSYLRRYVEFLLGPGDVRGHPELNEHVETTLLDLIVLAIGSQRDEIELARMRGLRSARTVSILEALKTGFTDPQFSSADVARKLGLSPRYINELLQDTNASLAERLLELRLQKARETLSDRRHDQMKISEIALVCGFSDISYFNRCFRRRFGCSPTQYRGG